MPDRSTLFPPGFLWGAATSAYQIEGSPLADGAGPSIWHEFAHTPGRTRDGDTGDLACDHYRRYRDDVALMGGLGLNAYRFSVSWSRVLPEGRGRINPQGLDFYQRLVDALLEQGIQPMLTLYHWDLPAALDRRGGWLNPDSADWFADYAHVLFRALDDRVRLWVTLNEPWVVVDGGYLHGVLAPGLRNPFAAPHAAHNLLRAHAAAAQAYRAAGRHQIGLVVNLEPKYPAAETAEDLAATMRADAYWNRQYLDPVFLGAYPPELAEIFGAAWPAFTAADLDALRQPPDFLGINYYSRQVVRHDPQRLAADRRPGPAGAADAYRPGLGSLSARSDRHPAMGRRPLRAAAALHHRKRRGLLRSAPNRRRGGRSPAPALPARPLAGGAGGAGRRRRPARLFRLVAAGQLRMGAWLQPALRPGPCRLRHPAAHRQSQRPILRGNRSRPRRDPVRQRGRRALTRPPTPTP